MNASENIQERFTLTWSGMNRVFLLASDNLGSVSQWQLNTLTYLYKQCNEEEKVHLDKRFPQLTDIVKGDV